MRFHSFYKSSVSVMLPATLVAACLWLNSAPAWAEVKLTDHDIMDRQGFSSPTPAYRFKAPENWAVTGGIRWNKPCSGDELFELVIRSTSPDGRYGFTVAPSHLVMWNDYKIINGGAMGIDPMAAQSNRQMVALVESQRNESRQQTKNTNCHVAVVEGTEQLVRNLILKARPRDARLLSIEVDPAGRKMFEDTIAAGAQVPGVTSVFDFVRVRVAYGAAGVEIEEEVMFGWNMTQQVLDDAMGGRTISQTTFVLSPHSWWAPAGELDEWRSVFRRMSNSLVAHEHWKSQTDMLRRRLAEERQRAANARNEERQRSNDEQHAKFIATIREEGILIIGPAIIKLFYATPVRSTAPNWRIGTTPMLDPAQR